MKQKLKNNKGMTLMEMLCTVVIVVIMSALLVTGMALASNTLAASVTASEARVLCDTLTTKLCTCIDQDGYDASYLTVVEFNDEDATPVAAGQCGELRWRDNKLVPDKTYPAMAGVIVTDITEDADSGENANVTLKLSVCNRNTGHEYSSNIIEIVSGGIKVYDNETASVANSGGSESTPAIENSDQSAEYTDD